MGKAMISERRRRHALVLPAAILAFTVVLFPVCALRFGTRAGYNVAFAIYWVVALVAPVWLLGWRRIVTLLRPAPLPRPKGLALAVLLVPVVGGAVVAFAPHIAGASALIVAVAIGRAAINATAEELLWRGVPTAALGGRGLLGWIYPALAFAAFHVAPLLVHGGWAAAPGILVGALWIGLGYGWIAGRSGSLAWTILAHVATDAMGLAAARFVLGG
jgi:membrane protease YdiL (CAAX protease family)